MAAPILLAPLAEERAAEEVLQLINDPDLSPDAQRDAFQLRLLIATGSDRTRQAIESLADPDPQRQAIALRLLALGPRALNPLLDSGLDVPNSLLSDESSMSDSGRDRHQVIVPQAPRSLDAEHVRPLIRATDPESAAYAGYLLALFGHEEGLESLLSYWRTQQGNDRLDRLVYRAIAALDDPQYIPLLREIRARLEDESSINEFYWTIRNEWSRDPPVSQATPPRGGDDRSAIEVPCFLYPLGESTCCPNHSASRWSSGCPGCWLP